MIDLGDDCDGDLDGYDGGFTDRGSGVEDIRLEMTCGACPEQYDAFIGERQVGYLRLRHGHFTVEVPDVRGDVVYSADTIGDGVFDESERDYHIQRAKEAIRAATIVDWQLSQRPAERRTCRDCGSSWTAPVDNCDCKLSRIRALIDSRGVPDDHAWALIAHREIRAILDTEDPR